MNVLTWLKITERNERNSERFQLMILSKTRHLKYDLSIDSNVINESSGMELVGLIINKKLSFEKHIAKLYQTVS